ncbi:TraR/DksA family transcriptional regulator [Cellulomonas sp. C5510]|uniref:TraR/DksA family transcriptional regulator n=1 Tax=Cellulomonas sp. C5510 TaxID=2871170 RepID=UPI001C98E0F6|nr:TraR/DksA family transcriptional regulator [Cellulomonas sp. C5510]QZN84455.1 TraR/DksA family transcriptional regulator [Cellulomonas sp. C5510]
MAINDSLSAHAPRTLPDLTDAATRFPVRAGEDAWTEQEVQEIATELVGEVDRLTAELAAADEELSNLLRNSGDGAGDDQADSGSSALEREHELTLVNNTRDMLEQTTRALARIDAGTFGRCDSCGEAIGKARVQAFPRATLCVACKQREERR